MSRNRGWSSWGSSGYTLPAAVGGAGSLDQISFDSDVEIVPNDTTHVLWFAPAALTITAIKLYYQVAGASVAGTYLFTATGAGNNLLAAANYNLESMVNATLTSSQTTPALALTGTAADLTLAEGDVVDLSFVSNNADLTGEGAYVQICFIGA